MSEANEASRRVGVYARYSSDQQSALSTADQLRLCRNYAAQQGWQVVAEYSDAAITGQVVERPDYIRLKKALRAGEFDTVLAESLDRLARDRTEASSFFDDCDYYGVELHTLQDGRVTEMHLGLRSTMSASFLKDRAAGADGQGGQLEIDPEQAEIVCWIFERYAEGWSAKRIAAELNRKSVKSPSGGIWRQSTINGNRRRGIGILNNELYVGFRVWNRQTFKRHPDTKKRQAHPNPPAQWQVQEVPELRIVPQELWDRVKARQKALDDRVAAQQTASGGASRRAGIGATRRSLRLLTPVLACGVCGGRMTASGGHYVACSTARESGASACSHMSNYRLDTIEARVLAVLKDELMSEAAITAFLEAYNTEIMRLNAEAEATRRRRARDLQPIEREIANLVDAVAQGYANAAIKDRLDQLEGQKAAIEAELAEPAAPAASFHPRAAELYRARVAELEAALRDPERGEAAREAVRGQIERAVVTPAPARGKKAFELEVEGELAALLQAAGMEQYDAASIDAASRSEVSGQLVAGAGFEPATFRL